MAKINADDYFLCVGYKKKTDGKKNIGFVRKCESIEKRGHHLLDSMGSRFRYYYSIHTQGKKQFVFLCLLGDNLICT